MAFSLYDASVANYLQTLRAVTGFLDRGLSHCKEKGVNPEEIVEARLFPDMLPFRFQIVSIAHHSRGAIEAVQKGVFLPFGGAPDLKYAALPSDGDRSARRAVGHDAGRGQYADRPRRRVPSRRA
jgi:uncharacterized protein